MRLWPFRRELREARRFRRRIIIGGLPRSGSTLLRFILDRSEGIISGPETGFFLHPLEEQRERPRRHASRVARKLGIDPGAARRAILGARTSFEAFDGLMRLFAERAGCRKEAWAEKSPRNCFHYERLAREDPQALFVSTIRNGLDVVTSRIEDHPRRAGEYWCSVERYATSMAAIHAFPGRRHRILRYEDLARDPLGTARGLFEFLGEPFDEECIRDFCRDSPTRDPGQVHQPKLALAVQPTWIDRWRAPEHRARVEEFQASAEAMEWLRRSGY